MSDVDSDSVRSVGDRTRVYSPVLNFIPTNFEYGIEDEVIINCAVEFFDGSVISSAKVEFWNKVNNDIQPPKRIGAKAASNNVKNILDLLRKCDNDDLNIPC
ncbi:hypothetical protein QYM36_005866 [Artemia franciscana]|uniref:Uncharacterized protein n=1 Tax=Artemia franciscana TaxID=6661 RepID=A0AA88IBA5_ARTSF|nr:hypothetical protein QYM36_005866 [Artemia franciscana]